VALEQDEEQHAERPHIHRQPRADALREHLGRPIGERADGALGWLRRALTLRAVELAREAKIDELDGLLVAREQQILWFDVCVAEALRVQQRDRAANLLEELDGLSLAQRVVAQVVQQLPARHILHHDKEPRVGLVKGLELGDALVHADALEDGDLTPYLGLRGAALLPRDHLDRHLLARLATRAQ